METLNKESFLREYELQDLYKEKLIDWGTIQDIYIDYSKKSTQTELEKVQKEITDLLNIRLKRKCHTIESRIKDSEHLVEKIIRKVCEENSDKYKKINKDNYREIVRDLIGVRVLVISKEDWEEVHDELCSIFRSKAVTDEKPEYFMEEPPKAYIRYGDRDVFRNKIKTQYSNKGYRSQHYVITNRNYYCEIQVRTIAEEVYGEFDHKVRYPYRKDNNFLLRYTTAMAQIMAVADELVSTCLQMPAGLWDECAKAYDKDVYTDWEQRNKELSVDIDKGSKALGLPADAKVMFANKILRKEGEQV